jgi:hypothetical protein
MMRLQRLALVSRDHRLREIDLDRPFTLIVGPHDSGKTAIHRIVEYVLGRGSCDIQKGVIRRNVAWYALRLQFKDRLLWLARRSPGADIGESDEYYLQEGDALGDLDPNAVTANSTLDGIVKRLSALLGIPPNKLLPKRGSALSLGEANIRHTIPLCLQPQDVLANSSTLFYRQHDDWMGRDFRAALPYFLGVVDDEQLQAQQLARNLMRQINQAEADIRHAKESARTVTERGTAIVTRAVKLQMVDGVGEVRQVLSQVAQWSPKKQSTAAPNAPNALRSRLAALHEKEATLEARRSEIDDFLAPEQLRGEHLDQAHSRLKSVSLIDSIKGDTCPVCGGDFHVEAQKELLLGIQSRVKVARKQVSSSKRSLTEAQAKIAEELSNVRAELRTAYAEIEADARMQGDVAESRSIDLQRGEVMAEARQWLRDLDVGRQVEGMQARVERLEQLHEQFASKLDAVGTAESEAAVLVRIASTATRLALQLGLPHSDGAIRLDLDNMTIVADTVKDGPIPLSQMGGAINWEAYHVVMHYAIHREMHTHDRPVPSFLIIDQPSQVGALSASETKASENRLAKLYQMFQGTETEIGPGFQIIVTEHESIRDTGIAPEPNVIFTLDDRLVPADWPGAS